MKQVIFTVEEAPEGGYTARTLGYSIFTEGESMDELRSQILDAVRTHFDDSDRPDKADSRPCPANCGGVYGN